MSILQTAYNKSLLEHKTCITVEDVEWVVKSGSYSVRMTRKLTQEMAIGKVNGLGVSGLSQGILLSVQAIAQKMGVGKGEVKISGVVEEEELHMRNSTSKRKSMAYSSLQNVLTLFKIMYNVDVESYFIHINFPTGIPVDGPSAGVTMFCSLYSALFGEPISDDVAMTGEVTIHGEVYP